MDLHPRGRPRNPGPLNIPRRMTVCAFGSGSTVMFVYPDDSRPVVVGRVDPGGHPSQAPALSVLWPEEAPKPRPLIPTINLDEYLQSRPAEARTWGEGEELGRLLMAEMDRDMAAAESRCARDGHAEPKIELFGEGCCGRCGALLGPPDFKMAEEAVDAALRLLGVDPRELAERGQAVILPANAPPSAEILDRAADRLAVPGAWVQSNPAPGNFDNSPSSAQGFNGCGWDIMGAVRAEGGDFDELVLVARALGPALPNPRVIVGMLQWHGADGRTADDVCAALRAGAALARSEAT